MISLHVYVNAKAGQEQQLESAIREKWLTAMADQPGFLKAALLKPLSQEMLDEVEAGAPKDAYEVVSFWTSEIDRRDWVARPIHDQVFAHVIEAAEDVNWTLQNVEESWSL